MTLAEMKNLAGACDGQGVQLGRDVGCTIKMRNLRHGGLIKTGLRYPESTDFDDAFLLLEEQRGNIIMLANANKVNFTPSDDTYTTDDNQKKTLDTLGLPEFEFIFEEGHHFYKNCSKLRSDGVYDFFYIDEDNTMALCDYGTEGLGGFEAGHVTPSMVMPKVAGETEKQMLMIQLIDRNAYDLQRALFVQSNHGISFRKHTGVNSLIVSFVGNVGVGTGAQIKVTLADGKTPKSGLIATNLLAESNNLNNVIVSLTETATPGTYDMVLTTALVAAETLKVKSWDATELVGNILQGTKLYFAPEVSTVVV